MTTDSAPAGDAMMTAQSIVKRLTLIVAESSIPGTGTYTIEANGAG